MRAFFVAALTAPLLLLFCAQPARAQTTQAYVVTDFIDNLTRVFATSNDQPITSFRAGLTPGVIGFSPDGRLAYIPNVNSGFLSVVDLTIRAEIFRVQGIRSTVAAVSPDGTRVVSTVASGPDAIVVNTTNFSTTTQNLGSLICDNSTPPSCDTLSSFIVAGSKAYFNPSGPFVKGVVAVDLSSTPAGPFIIPGSALSSPTGNLNTIAATPDGKDVIVLENGPPRATVLVIDTTTNTVVQSLSTDIFPLALAVTPTTRASTGVFAYVFGVDSLGNNVVQAYSVSGGTLSLGARSAALPLTYTRAAESPDGTRLYLAADGTNALAVINTATPASSLPLLEQLQVGTSIVAISTANIQTQPLTTAPVVGTIVPQIVVNSASNSTLVSGANFTSNALVRFGDLDPVSGTLSGSSLLATVPAAAAAQGADIIVTDPNSSQPVSGQHQSGILRGQFTIANPPSFQPSNQVIVDDGAETSVGVLNGSTTSTLFQTTPGFTAALPIGVAITPDASRAYLVGFIPPAVYAYNIVNSTIEATLPLNPSVPGFHGIGGQEDPVAVVNSPVTNGGPAAYAAWSVPLPDGKFDLAVSIIDANPNNTSTFNTVVKQFQAGLDEPIFLPGGLAVTPDGRYVYANAQQSITAPGWSFFTLVGSVVAFDVTTGATHVLDVSTLAPGGLAGFQGHIEVSPNGKSLLLLAANGGVAVFDISTNPMSPTYVATITGTPPAGFGPLTFLEYRIPKNVPNELVAFDSLQNVLQIFNFNRASSNFSLLGSVVIPGTPGLRDAFGLDVTPDGKLIYGLLVQDDAVAVIDASNPASPVLVTKIRAGLAPGSLAVRPGTPTPAGTNVKVEPLAFATISFSSITSPGVTTVTTTNATPFGPPPGFQLAGIPVYFNVSTTAVFSGPVVACFTYDPTLLPSPESGLRLAHFDTTLNAWTDVTLSGSPNTTTHTICGQVGNPAGPFVIGVAIAPVISSISSNFNGTVIAGNDFIWFNSVLSVNGLGAKPVTVFVTNATIRFTANGTPYSLAVPNAAITFSPAVTTATTSFDALNNRWVTTVPSAGLAGNVFLDGLAFLVPAGGLPGGINPVTWQVSLSTDTPGITVSWKWGAAVYTSFSANNNALGVKPVDDNTASQYQNSDHAGTPENFKSFVTGGARGGGGSNYTGSYSGTGSVGF